MLGKTLSHYRILRKLEERDTFSLYLAQDLRLDRKIALKVFPPHLNADQEKLSRFLQEGRAASVLDHPSIVHVYEIGQEEGIHFIAMQHVEGQTLEQKAVERPLRLNEIIDIGFQVADALDQAHSKGVSHGNISAATILIDTRKQIKLTDFGKATSDVSAGPTREELRSDVYSLGVLLYKITAGQDPAENGTLPVEPPSRLNYDVPPEMDRIILKCLDKDPARRYQSTTDLVVDLKNLRRDKESGKITAEHTLSKPARVKRFQRFIAPGLLILAIAVFLWTFQRGGDRNVRSLAVLPFANESSNPEYEYLSDGITDTIINSLSRLPNVKVLSRGTVFSYKDKVVDPRQIRRDLNVDAVVMGSIFQEGDVLRVQASLVSTSDGAQLWGNQFNKKPTDIIEVQTSISNEIADQLRLKLSGAQKQQVQKQHTQDVDAYRLYLKGRYYWNKRTGEGFQKAIESFRHAIQKDPKYALAFAGLADTYSLQGNWGFLPPKDAYSRAKEAAVEALRIDETLAEAHTSLASVVASYDWNWTDAEKHFRRAIELNSNYSTAHHWYSFFLSQMGRQEEALQEIRLAQSLDPLSLIINANHGYTLYVNRRYDEALQQIQKTLDLDPDFALAYQYRGYIYEQKRMHQESIEALEKAVALAPENITFHADLARAYAASGNIVEGTRRLERLLAISQNRYVPSYDFANICIGLGQNDQAIEWLERSYTEHSDVITYIKMEPRMDPLRNDPRFQSLLKRIGLG